MLPVMTTPLTPAGGLPPVPAGLVLAPFRALRFDEGVVGDLTAVISPPYDVIDDAARDALEAGSDHNVVRLILPRDEAGHPDSRYDRAAATLDNWRAEGALTLDETSTLYVYEQTEAGHVQRGLLGAVALARPEDDIVLPHENVMPKVVADRLRLMETVGVNLEPIFLVYDGGGAASRIVAEADKSQPLIDVTTPDDGIRHRIWAITDEATLAEIAADLLPRRAVIADGHHRYTTYLQAQDARHAAGDGAGPWDYGLTFLVDATAFGPQVHPIHRAIASLPLARAVELAQSAFSVERLSTSDADDAIKELARAGESGTAFLLSDGAGEFQLLTSPDPAVLDAAVPHDRTEAWRALDVTIAHFLLIQHVWQLEDTVDVVDFQHSTEESLLAARASGGTALLLNPTPVADVVAVASAGDRMPRKSTLFTPKPRTGLIIRPVRGA
ncbi:MAG: hypothetical protein QOF57_2006 [Frankiaceae bacterium]|nr:hypothetical protein [Frankiaceae bacterium]